jgi:hypothetical protein
VLVLLVLGVVVDILSLEIAFAFDALLLFATLEFPVTVKARDPILKLLLVNAKKAAVFKLLDRIRTTLWPWVLLLAINAKLLPISID